MSEILASPATAVLTDALEYMLPEMVVPEPPEFIENPAEYPNFLSTAELVKASTLEHREVIEAAEKEGIPRPVLALFLTQCYGETREHLMDAAAQYAETGMVQPVNGDNISYFKAALEQCIASGVTPRVYGPPEAWCDASIIKTIYDAGLNVFDVFVETPELGVMDDLAAFHKERVLLDGVRDFDLELQRIYRAKDPNDPATKAKLEELVERLANNEVERAELEARIDARLLEEDEKIAALVASVQDDPEIAGNLVFLKSYHPKKGQEIICEQLTNPYMDLDNLSTVIPEEERIWTKLTPQAMMLVAEYYAREILGCELSDIDPEEILQLGYGLLVGVDLDKLLHAGQLIKRGKDVVRVGQEGSDKPVSVIMTASLSDRGVNGDKFIPGSYGKILIVDAGCVQGTNPKTNKPESHSNTNPASIKPGGNVYVTRRFGGVGPVTAVKLCSAAIEANIMQARLRQQLEQLADKQARQTLGTLGIGEMVDLSALEAEAVGANA